MKLLNANITQNDFNSSLPRFLDGENLDEFISYCREHGVQSVKYLVRLIVERGSCEANFRKLMSLAWCVFAVRQHQSFGENTGVTIPDEVCFFQETVYLFQPLLSLHVPFSQWVYLIDEMFASLQRDFAIKDKSFLMAFERVHTSLSKEISCILRQPEFISRYTEFINGSD